MAENKFLNELIELEAIADLMIDKATRLKKEAHKERLKLEGVSTPSVRKGVSEKEVQSVIAKRHQNFFQKKPASATN